MSAFDVKSCSIMREMAPIYSISKKFNGIFFCQEYLYGVFGFIFEETVHIKYFLYHLLVSNISCLICLQGMNLCVSSNVFFFPQ
jgi:hypothetical protein